MSRGAWVLLLLVVAGCPVPPVARPYSAPTAEELLESLRARARAIHSLRAEAKVDQLGPRGQRAKVRISMLVGRGGRLRLEAESPLAGPIATLTSDGRDFQLLDTHDNRFLTGPARACNLARLLQLELEPEEVVSVLLGSAPLDGEPAEVGWDPQHGGREILTLRRADGEVLMWLDGRERRWDPLAAERRATGGQVVWRLRHEEFSDKGGGIRLPARTTVEEPPHHTDAQVKFRAQEPNVELSDGAFHLEPPSGIPAEPVGCQ